MAIWSTAWGPPLNPWCNRLLFNSYTFIFAFLPICLIGFAVLARTRRRAAIGWLVLCSLAYYGWWNPAYLVLIVGSIAFNYYFGVLLSRRPSRSILTLGIVANLVLLGYFKYAGFLVGIGADLFGTGWSIGHIVLPLAISFFTFQQIAYLVDAHRGLASEYSFLDYALFVTYFPQLIAGPIVHHSEMLPQFRRPDTGVTSRDLSIGFGLFAMGLFKKAVFADTFAGYATPVFDSAAQGNAPDMVESIVASLAYTLQLYFDFSGYSEMALGAARMFGIRLPLNFDSPYKAVSISDFWRRWHITLSRFLRDYLYIPLGGNRYGQARRYVNLMLTMLLGGLWHGAGWTFVFWGVLHGVYLCINHAWGAMHKKLLGDRFNGPLVKISYGSITFIAVVFGWIFFRAADFPTAGRIISGAIGQHGLGSVRAHAIEIAAIAIGLLIVWSLPNTQQWFWRYRPALTAAYDRVRPSRLQRMLPRLRFRPGFIGALVIATIFVVAVIHLTRVSEFIYYQF